MKRLLLCIALLALLGSVNAQDRETEKPLQSGHAYYSFNINAADTLTSNQDTVDFVLINRNIGLVKRVAILSQFDTIAGADTSVSITVAAKEFEGDTYAEFISTVLDTVAEASSILMKSEISTIAFLAPYTNVAAGTVDTLHYQPIIKFNNSYRYYRVRYIYSGEDYTGEGIKIDALEFKFYY